MKMDKTKRFGDATSQELGKNAFENERDDRNSETRQHKRGNKVLARKAIRSYQRQQKARNVNEARTQHNGVDRNQRVNFAANNQQYNNSQK